MSIEVKAFITTLLIVILLVAATIGISAVSSRANCYAKTANIGFAHTWGLYSGCMIEPTPGKWIPLENWRMIE